MLFRTRDFLLFMLTIAFLVIGISYTIGIDLSVARQKAALLAFNDTNEVIVYQGELPPDVRQSRPARILELKDKVLAFLQTNKDMFAVPKEESLPPDSAVATSVVPLKNEIITCPNYAVASVAWSPSDLSFEVVEGARLLYRESTNTPANSAVTATSSREAVLQLPLPTVPQAQKTCLRSDIVGIALDGSLIRNNEQGLYGIFGETTLIGYALDGFPIYGLSQAKTDQCGGIQQAGEYRYYLNSARVGVLGCFSGRPVNL